MNALKWIYKLYSRFVWELSGFKTYLFSLCVLVGIYQAYILDKLSFDMMSLIFVYVVYRVLDRLSQPRRINKVSRDGWL